MAVGSDVCDTHPALPSLSLRWPEPHTGARHRDYPVGRSPDSTPSPLPPLPVTPAVSVSAPPWSRGRPRSWSSDAVESPASLRHEDEEHSFLDSITYCSLNVVFLSFLWLRSTCVPLSLVPAVVRLLIPPDGGGSCPSGCGSVVSALLGSQPGLPLSALPRGPSGSRSSFPSLCLICPSSFALNSPQLHEG